MKRVCFSSWRLRRHEEKHTRKRLSLPKVNRKKGKMVFVEQTLQKTPFVFIKSREELNFNCE